MNDLRKAAQQALEALECGDWYIGQLEAIVYIADDKDVHEERAKVQSAITALRAALAEYDKDRLRIAERKAKWAEQLKLARETQERDRQQREYEEQRLAALAAPVQEPVAWRCSVCGGGPLLCLHNQTDVPLYAEPPQRKPLTDEEIIDAVRDADLDWMYGWTLDETQGNRFETLARAIERAHGIT